MFSCIYFFTFQIKYSVIDKGAKCSYVTDAESEEKNPQGRPNSQENKSADADPSEQTKGAACPGDDDSAGSKACTILCYIEIILFV